MKNIHAIENRKLTKARIAEVSRQEETDDELNVDNEVCAVQSNLKCWNCDKLGHSYIDCMEQRKIFCYGCGAKDIYRPTRLLGYPKTRAKIFSNKQPIRRSSMRIRNYYRKLKSYRSCVISSVVNRDSDNRPYVNLKVEQTNYFALLDRGANSSVIG